MNLLRLIFGRRREYLLVVEEGSLVSYELPENVLIVEYATGTPSPNVVQVA